MKKIFLPHHQSILVSGLDRSSLDIDKLGVFVQNKLLKLFLQNNLSKDLSWYIMLKRRYMDIITTSKC